MKCRGKVGRGSQSRRQDPRCQFHKKLKLSKPVCWLAENRNRLYTGSYSVETESTQLNERAEELMDAEQWAEAIKLLESKPLFETDAELSWNLGWAYFKLGDLTTAQLHLSRARALNPGRAASWWALGVVQREAGLLEEAEWNVKEALRLRDSSNFRQTLALILMRRGKSGEAEQVHLKGIKLKPESPERWTAYACFLDDCRRQNEAEVAYKKARLLLGN